MTALSTGAPCLRAPVEFGNGPRLALRRRMRTLVLLSTLASLGCHPALPYGGVCAEDIKVGQRLADLTDAGAFPARFSRDPSWAGAVVSGQRCQCAQDGGCTDCFYTNLTEPYWKAPCSGLTSSPGALFHCGAWTNAEGLVVGVYANCEHFN